MWQRFTERARKVVFYAQEEAQRFGVGYVSTEHLLLGLVREEDNVASQVLAKLGVTSKQIRKELEPQMPKEALPSQDMTLTPRAKRVIDLAYHAARELNNNYMGTEHLLLALISEGDGLAARVLAKLGVEIDSTTQAVIEMHEQSPSEAGATHPRVAPDPWAMYTDSGKQAIVGAFDEKNRSGEEKVTAEHLLLAIADDTQSSAALLLERLGITADRLRTELGLEGS
ncbi:MAG TPA: Clp protease N-terminal domain-containing protein [Fimbriimonas sp.]|nr:Clp protease N-terminal domain-containing protein [Fimbriimonas sp.]